MFSISLFTKDRYILSFFCCALGLQILEWWYALFQIHPIAGETILHYTSIFGVDLIGPWWRVMLLPISGLCVLIINTVFGLFFYNHERLLARLILFGTAVLQIAVLVSLWSIAGLNA